MEIARRSATVIESKHQPPDSSPSLASHVHRGRERASRSSFGTNELQRRRDSLITDYITRLDLDDVPGWRLMLNEILNLERRECVNASLLDVRLRISVLVTHLNTTERVPETTRADKTATTRHSWISVNVPRTSPLECFLDMDMTCTRRTVLTLIGLNETP